VSAQRAGAVPRDPGEAGLLRWSVEPVPEIAPELGEALVALWRRDAWASPFAGAAFLGVMLEAARPRRGLFALGRRADGSLAAAWPLLDRDGRLELAQGHRVDHGACIAAPDVDPDELGRGLATAITESGARSVFLDHLPPWGPTLAAARAGLLRAGWRARAFPSNPCPVLALAPGADLGERLRAEANRHRRMRVYANKLGRLPGFRFEALEDADDLEGWTRDFCDAHEWRWNATPTPSEYRFRAARERTLACLKAWQRDGTLVRFSVGLGGARLALVAALRVPHRLVYHLVATSPAGAPHRAGQVLVRAVLLWMAERGLPVLDFGIGDEDYKLRYANQGESLWRVFGARHGFARDLVRGALEAPIRRSSRLQELWDEWANRRVRGRLVHGLRSLRIRWRGARARATSPGELAARARARLRGERAILYRARGTGGAPGAELEPIGTFEALEILEREPGLLPAARARAFSAAELGARAFAARLAAPLRSVAWLVELSPGQRPAVAWEEDARVWLVWTPPPHQPVPAHAHAAPFLRSLLRRIPPGGWAVVAAPPWSGARRRALEEVGFEPLAGEASEWLGPGAGLPEARADAKQPEAEA
jgi:CelD/BcsL family acetyltransferase involved in cellulose biosynthesis